MSITSVSIVGAMAELVDAPVLGTGLARGEGSSPFRPTIGQRMDTIFTGMEGMGIGEGQRRLMEVVMTTVRSRR